MKGLQEISLKAHKEQNLISTHFFKSLTLSMNLKREHKRKLFYPFNGEILVPKVFTMFSNPREPHYIDIQP